MSLAVLKKKTLNGNPRQAPISGSNNGKFGFSLNGTRRGNHMGRETNLAPGPMTGPSQMIPTSPSYPTGPGIYGHVASVCTNDPTVVKTTVMNTRGMLAKRLRGIERIPPMAPSRNQNVSDCGMGDIISEPDTYWSSCKDNGFCTGPLTVNWVKDSNVPNGNQKEYIERIVKVNGRTSSKTACESTKSFNGVLGVLDASGLVAIQNLPQGSSTNGKLSETELESLVNSKSIMPFTSLCSRLNEKLPENLRNNLNRTPVSGIENWKSTGRSSGNKCPVSKPGISTVDYGTYISKRLLSKNYLPPQLECNKPQPNPNLAVSCSKTAYDNYWNNNIPPSVQWASNPFTN